MQKSNKVRTSWQDAKHIQICTKQLPPLHLSTPLLSSRWKIEKTTRLKTDLRSMGIMEQCIRQCVQAVCGEKEKLIRQLLLRTLTIFKYFWGRKVVRWKWTTLIMLQPGQESKKDSGSKGVSCLQWVIYHRTKLKECLTHSVSVGQFQTRKSFKIDDILFNLDHVWGVKNNCEYACHQAWAPWPRWLERHWYA